MPAGCLPTLSFLSCFAVRIRSRALAELLNISDTQLSYVENADPGCGLMKFGGAFIPFVNSFPEDTELYKLMTTKPADREQVKPHGV